VCLSSGERDGHGHRGPGRLSYSLQKCLFGFKLESEYTFVKFLTDGMLVNEMLSDPLLSDYSVIMVDDIHERSLNTDLVLGLLKK